MAQLSFKVERKHWRLFAAAASRRAGFGGGLIYTVGFTALVVLASEIIKRCQNCNIEFPSYSTGVFLTLCIWSVWTYLFYFYAGGYAKEDGVILGDRKLDVTPEGVTASGLRDKVSYAWEVVEGVSSHGAILVVWTDWTSGIIIPRASFASSQDEREFRQLVGERIAAASPRHSG